MLFYIVVPVCCVVVSAYVINGVQLVTGVITDMARHRYNLLQFICIFVII